MYICVQLKNRTQNAHIMQIRLNEKNATDFKPKAERYEVRDTIVRGLILRVGKKGDKVWEVIVSNGAKRKRHRLGMFPALSVKEARRVAEEKKQERISIGAGIQEKTVADLFDSYKASKSPIMRAWRDVESVWVNWASDRIGHVRLTDVTFHHGRDLRDYVSGQSSPLRGGAVIRYLRPMFSWAENEGLIPVNPWAGLKAGATSMPRDRILNTEEWSSVWDASFTEDYPFGPFLRTLMLSAQRLDNVASIRWDEIDGDIWTIPREKVKSTKPEKARAHEVPLSGALIEIIESQPPIGPYVFTTLGDRPIRPGSKLKNRLSAIADVSNWQLHDIRRSAATIMTTEKVSRFIVERVLAHKDNSVTAVYDRSSYRDEKREALEVLAESVLFINENANASH